MTDNPTDYDPCWHCGKCVERPCHNGEIAEQCQHYHDARRELYPEEYDEG